MSYHSDFDAHLDNYGSPGPSGGDDERDFEEEAYNRDFMRDEAESELEAERAGFFDTDDFHPARQ